MRFPRAEIRREWRSADSRGEARERLAEVHTKLHEHYYDLIVDWQSNLRSAWIRLRTRHRNVLQLHPADGGELPQWWYGWRPRSAAGRVHRIERAMHLVRELGYEGETPAGEVALGDSDNGPVTESPPVLLHPFVSAFGRFKEWPLTHWRNLARRLVESGHPVWLSGGPGERSTLEDLARKIGDCATLAPQTKDAADLGRLIRCCRAVVAADTGVIHLSALLGIPSLGLYGPKDPAVHGPTGPNTMVLRSGIPCSPCLLRRCDHSLCMSSLSVEKVFEGVDSLIGSRQMHS